MDEPTNKPADSAASGEATPETSPTSGGETAPPDFPVPRIDGDGKPIYDQQFFLALARRGKEVWNRWRAANPRIEGQPYTSVTFEGVDFREPANAVIDFSGVNFGDSANFRACKFEGADQSFDAEDFLPGMAKFTGATFGVWADFSGATFDWAYFSGAIFGDGADLSSATFGDVANFSGATFGERADFSGATFGDGADFSGATFGNGANFSGATFDWAYFLGATFGDVANFSGATFGDGANFSGATFRGFVCFNAWSEAEWRQFRSYLLQAADAMRSWAEERKQQFLHIPEFPEYRVPLGPDTFLNLKFERVQFEGVADFSGRKLIGRLDFTRARFNQPPIFDGCKGTEHLDFYGARMGFAGKLAVLTPSWTTLSDTALRLRKLFTQYWREGWKGRLRLRMLGHSLWTAVGRCWTTLSGTALRLRKLFTQYWREGWKGRLRPRGWTALSDTALRLRSLRALAEGTKNHDLERDLYIEERKAERGILLRNIGAKDGQEDSVGACSSTYFGSPSCSATRGSPITAAASCVPLSG